MADVEWNFRTCRHARLGGRPMALSVLYKLFANRFYCGFVTHKGILYRGTHLPMVTGDEFERAQKIIRRQLRKALQKHNFAFTGIMRCGSCGCSITAEVQTNKYGRTYEYYRCTKKRRDMKCTEKYVSRAKLEAQIVTFLRAHEVEPVLADWTSVLDSRTREGEVQLREQRTAQIAKQRAENERALATLTDLRLRDLIEDDEFVAKRAEILTESERLKDHAEEQGGDPEKWLEFSAAVKRFNKKYAPDLFISADDAMKRKILTLAGSNFSLIGKKLSIEAADFYALFIRGPDIISGRGQREYVRTFSDEKVRDEFLLAVRYLQKAMSPEQRLKYFCTTSLTSLRPPNFKHWSG